MNDATKKSTPDAIRWARIKADPVLLERERARTRALYARSLERRQRQQQTGAAWRKNHPDYPAEYAKRRRTATAAAPLIH